MYPMSHFTKSQNVVIHHVGKKHSASKPDVAFKCKPCYQAFSEIYALRQHKNNQHGFIVKTKSVEPDEIKNEIDDTNPKEELHLCQHFLLDSKLVRARQKVLNYEAE